MGSLCFPLRTPAQGIAPDGNPSSVDLPQPLPPKVQRARVVETLPAPRFYFNPVPIRSHYGLRLALGGGAQWQQGAPASAPGGTLHLDVGVVGRIVRGNGRPLGRFWQSALWHSAGYSYAYARMNGADGAARHLFAGGLGIGLHKASPPSAAPDSRRREESARLALGWTPSILLGRSQGEFTLGARSTFSIELSRHTVGLHLSYEFIHVWNGAFLHDASLSLSFDPFGLFRY